MAKFLKKKSVIDDQTAVAEWYMKDAKTDAVKSRLRGTPDGTFAIRNSSSEPGKYVLAYQAAGQMKNLHIDGDSGQVKLSKSTKSFSSMAELVRYYSDNETIDLQCRLINADLVDPKVAKKLAKEKMKREKEAAKSPRGSLPNLPGAGPPGASGGVSKAAARGYGKEWKVQDVGDWLYAMDMGEYIPLFKKSKIDGTALLMLDDNALRELGVGAFAARKKLMQAINNLNKKFEAIEKGEEPPPPGMDGTSQAPITTIGLVARKVDGVVKIFDIETGAEVYDIAAHQKRKHEEIASGRIPHPDSQGGDGGPARTFTINQHEMESWYDKNLLKAKIHELLEPLPNGNFVVRDSNTNPGCFTFSMVCQGKVHSKIIEPADGSLRFKSASETFPNLCALIDHYTRTTGGIIPCMLRYPTEGSRVKISALPYWNCMDLGKKEALEKIKGKSAGAFVIRPSDKSFAAISLVKPDGSMYNQHIEETPRGLQLKKSTVTHPDLTAFVNHYSLRSQTDLPCPLMPNM